MDFMESEAEESDDEYKTKNSGDEDEEEDVDEEEIAEEMKDLINDDDDEEVEGSGNESDIGKRKHEEESDLDDQLDDDDLDLIEENLGIKVKRKQKRKRIRMISDGEESEKEEEEARDVIANELFEGVEGDEDQQSEMGPPRSERGPGDEFGDLEQSEEESDVDDFIVDEEGQSLQKKKKKRTIIHDDKALQEAQDIFGVDFDFEEFEQYDDDYGDEEEEEEEYEDDTVDDGEAAPRRPKKARKKKAAKSIFEMYEPSDLERAGFTDFDNEVRTSDMPERFQLRKTPVQGADDAELEEEAEWIYNKAFVNASISKQDTSHTDGGYGSTEKKEPSAIGKIKEALRFMRNQQFEVPFIAFYRKEYVEPELNINDLWRVWHFDEKWTQLRIRKKNLVVLFEKMQLYQCDMNMDPDKPLDANFRCLTSDDIHRVKSVESMDQLRDVYQHFLLYYGGELPKMKNAEREKKRKEAAQEGEEGAEGEKEEEETHDAIKQATRKSAYSLCERAGLGEMAKRFGLTPEEFGVNLRDNYQKNEVEQDPAEPLELAQEYISNQFPTAEDVMKGARHMVALQIAHDPTVRNCVRETFYERAKITAKPTAKGVKLINEDHPCNQFKYLKNKPVGDLSDDQFLHLDNAEKEGMMTMDIHIDEPEGSGIVPYFEEIKQLYYKDEFSRQVQEWNSQRSMVLERALEKVLYPHFIKELRTKLLEEANDGIIKACCRKLMNWLKVAPYQVDQQMEDDEDYMEGSEGGLRVMGLAYSTERDNKVGDTCSFAVMVDGDGEVQDFLRLTSITKRRNAYNEAEAKAKKQDLEKVREFILTKKPHVIAISAFCRMADRIAEDLRDVIRELEEDQQIPPISVELVDNELATIFMNSKRSEHDFREYPLMLRHAISTARRIQDPLVEFSQSCNADEDILCIKFHPLQDQVPKEDLMGGLNLVFVNRVNEVGVDVNRCTNHAHAAGLVQFVCGLGQRKGNSLLKVLKQNNARLENRTQLVTMCHMGPKVFINCSGFIKIDTNSLGDSTESYVEVLDGSRVHPETYEWARKMAVDALEYDDTAADANPSSALEEILESPERLKDLDLDAFAEELERQGYGNKHTTLYDIRAELNHRYKELRVPYRSPTNEEKFNMLTQETPQTFYNGKLVVCTVRDIARRRPQGDQLDQANPDRINATGLWQCPFCLKEDFPELSEVWNHFDGGGCPGQAVGVRTVLDNGVQGFIPTKFISDKKVTNPEERVQIGMSLHARITKIDIDRFAVDLTCRSSDLLDKENSWRLPKDLYYDNDQEEADLQKDEEKKKQKARQTYVKRVIAHPSFHNIGFNECEKLMKNMEQGDAVIRPSSKGSDHLTASWKVSDSVHAHLDIREEGKENTFSIGSSLWIGNEEFEDLDEIIARHINPMAAFARDLLNYRYYQDAEGGKKDILEKMLYTEKKKAPSRIPYAFSASAQYPGKFLISYLPRHKVRHEFLSVTPDGVRYRGQVFTSLNSLVRWFKEHFRDPIPGTPQTMRTPMANPVTATPSINLQSVDAATIQRAAAGLPSNIYNTLAQVAGATPAQQFNTNQPSFTPGYRGGFNFNPPQQHMSTPMMTPMMTPSYQTSQSMTTPRPHAMATPQYQPTPQQQAWNQAISTPRSTPSQARQVTPAQAAAAQAAVAAAATGRPATSGLAGVATDWAKAAEMWAKKRQTQTTKGTPRGKSPAVRPSPSPMVESTPAGDGTPLIDER